MKNIIGKIAGFILGAGSFLFLFKIFILSKKPPSDELAPGIVVLSAVSFGIVIAFIGSYVQSFIKRKSTLKN
jgi:CDP-diglyceride synthetase